MNKQNFREINKKYFAIQDDMEKRLSSGKLGGLSLSDFLAVSEIGKKMLTMGNALVSLKQVADYYEKFGFVVVKSADGANFRIFEE